MIENILITMEKGLLTNRIMRRVYAVYVLRCVLHPTLCKLYGVLVAVGGVAVFVSFGSVLQNVPSDISYFYSFFVYAFAHTEFIVQLLVVSAVLFLGWLVFDIVARLSHGAHAPQVV
jgi:hypothetical protein